uniref:Uncharacterized protein n=1 Tax=Setaria digitata TaxID=48799 RepID=A0A915PSS5_9BILA
MEAILNSKWKDIKLKITANSAYQRSRGNSACQRSKGTIEEVTTTIASLSLRTTTTTTVLASPNILLILSLDKEPIKYAIAILTKLLRYQPYDRSIRLKRCALWKTLQNHENAIIDALVYFCIETTKDCFDVPLEDISQVLTNDFNQLVNEECHQIDGYAGTLKPFLTQDFINLWLACDCDDPLVEDIWNVRQEQRGTLSNDAVPLQESQYKQALKALSNGELSSVMDILEGVFTSGKYGCEAALLLALAHTRFDGSVVDKYLDRFEQIWDQKAQSYCIRRRKQLIVRYVSISRAIRFDPFSGRRFENMPKEMDANLYLQEALVIFWRRENTDFGEVFWKEGLREDNMRKLRHIRKLCDLALKAKPNFYCAKILKMRSILELQMVINISLLTDQDLKPFENIVDEVNRTLPKYNAFGDLCLYSIYFVNLMDDKAKLRCMQMIGTLFFRGQPLVFLIKNDWYGGEKQTLERLNGLISKEPENYVAHILMYCFYFKHGDLNSALTHADFAIKYWPYHVNTNNLLPHVRGYIRCRILQGVQQELDLAVEASFHNGAIFHPAFGDMQEDRTELEKKHRKSSTETNSDEPEKSFGILKAYCDFSEREQFISKLRSTLQQGCEMSEIPREKKNSEVWGSETGSSGNFKILNVSEKFSNFEKPKKKVFYAGKMITAAYIYADQLRYRIENQSRLELSEYCSAKRRIEDGNHLSKRTMKFEKPAGSEEKIA